MGLRALLSDQQRYEEAEEAGRTAVALRSSADQWAELGRIQTKLKKYEAAEDSLTKAVTLDPTLSGPWSELGILFAKTNRYEDSVQSFERALEADPEKISSAFFCGLSLALSGNPIRALPYFEKVEAFGDLTYGALLANVYASIYSKHDLAQEIARKVANLATIDNWDRIMLADTFAECGSWGECFRFLEMIEIKKLGELVDERSDVGGVTNVLIKALRAGRGREVVEFLKGAGREEVFEPVLYAARSALGETIEDLPAEIANAVDEVRIRVSGADEPGHRSVAVKKPEDVAV
jgi:tetratricopeptide (TPR) repeat protein